MTRGRRGAGSTSVLLFFVTFLHGRGKNYKLPETQFLYMTFRLPPCCVRVILAVFVFRDSRCAATVLA